MDSDLADAHGVLIGNVAMITCTEQKHTFEYQQTTAKMHGNTLSHPPPQATYARKGNPITTMQPAAASSLVDTLMTNCMLLSGLTLLLPPAIFEQR